MFNAVSDGQRAEVPLTSSAPAASSMRTTSAWPHHAAVTRRGSSPWWTCGYEREGTDTVTSCRQGHRKETGTRRAVAYNTVHAENTWLLKGTGGRAKSCC